MGTAAFVVNNKRATTESISETLMNIIRYHRKLLKTSHVCAMLT